MSMCACLSKADYMQAGNPYLFPEPWAASLARLLLPDSSLWSASLSKSLSPSSSPGPASSSSSSLSSPRISSVATQILWRKLQAPITWGASTGQNYSARRKKERQRALNWKCLCHCDQCKHFVCDCGCNEKGEMFLLATGNMGSLWRRGAAGTGIFHHLKIQSLLLGGR